MNRKLDKITPELHPVRVKSPWYHIGIDFVGPIAYKSSNGMFYSYSYNNSYIIMYTSICMYMYVYIRIYVYIYMLVGIYKYAWQQYYKKLCLLRLLYDQPALYIACAHMHTVAILTYDV